MTLEELEQALRETNKTYDCIYLHWTADDYDSLYSDYHLCIDGEGNIHYTLDFSEIPVATWHRNSRSIAIALCCCKDATLYRDSTDFGYYKPTFEQIECLAQVIATISNTLHLPISRSFFMTHAEAAELDEYGPTTTCERWDLWTLPQSTNWGSGGDFIRGKALFYQKQWNEE